jgi:hypothetical protein
MPPLNRERQVCLKYVMKRSNPQAVARSYIHRCKSWFTLRMRSREWLESLFEEDGTGIACKIEMRNASVGSMK